MPNLTIIKTPDGSPTGHKVTLGKENVVIGRSPTCGLHLNLNAVSREHAQVVFSNAQYVVEDLKSRNGTFVNNKRVEGRSTLKDGDSIKICDFLISYRDENAKNAGLLRDLGDLSRSKSASPEPEPEEENSNTTVEATFHRVPPNQFLDTQPQEKLRAILDISTALSKTLDIDKLLPMIAEELFKVFKQADRCFIIQNDETNRLIPVVTKSRRPNPDAERFSRTIVKKCIESLESYLSEDATSDSAIGLAQSIAEFKIRSVMCVPMVTSENKAIGVLQLDSQDRTKKFTQDDLKLLICVAAQASVALENARMHTQLLFQQKLEQENMAATKVQKGFLPQSMPLMPGYEFYSHYVPARTVGGDYYDFIPLPDGRLAILLGDVSGKGVPAALLMARLSGEARVAIYTTAKVTDAITKLNDQLMQANLEDRYVTLSAFILDPKSHTVEIVNAGHLSPWHMQHSGNQFLKVFDKDTGDFPIGWVPGHCYSSHTLSLQPGDSLVVYTDGIEDAQPTNGQRFLEDGVVKTVNSFKDTVKPLTAREIGSRLIKAVEFHAANHPQFDDIAIVCFGRVEPTASSPPTPTAPTAHGEGVIEL